MSCTSHWLDHPTTGAEMKVWCGPAIQRNLLDPVTRVWVPAISHKPNVSDRMRDARSLRSSTSAPMARMSLSLHRRRPFQRTSTDRFNIGLEQRHNIPM
jgi:hypothetical protein